MEDGRSTERTDHLLQRIQAGGEGAREAWSSLFERLYDDLRGVARGLMRRERPDHTLRPTALVHEAYLRLVGEDGKAFDNRAHFFAVAARAMRQVLVDHARHVEAKKRGGDRQRITLDESLQAESAPSHGILDLDAALDRLRRFDERAARVAEMRVFAGMTSDEIAAAVGVSSRTVDGDWSMARLWLSRELGAS